LFSDTYMPQWDIEPDGRLLNLTLKRMCKLPIIALFEVLSVFQNWYNPWRSQSVCQDLNLSLRDCEAGQLPTRPQCLDGETSLNITLVD
jgi:hypothetical protein